MVPQADIEQFKSAHAAGAAVIDVREPFEFASGHVPRSVSIPMHLVPLRLDEFPADREIYVICAAGNRSWQVCNFLGERGVKAVNVVGGMMAWQAAGQPIEGGAAGSPDANRVVAGGAHS